MKKDIELIKEILTALEESDNDLPKLILIYKVDLILKYPITSNC